MRIQSQLFFLLMTAISLVFSTAVIAEKSIISSAEVATVAYAPKTKVELGSPGEAAAMNAQPLIFSAPPRESTDVGKEKYEPVAAYLSQVLGRKVIYQHPGTWGVYRTEMLKGAYDLAFDGPHFNSYRAQHLHHNILVKIPKRHEFVVIVQQNAKFKDIDSLTGRTFCSHAPPNLGTLVLLNEFPNPARQPVILNTKGWTKIYEGVVNGRCVAGILPILNLQKFDPNGKTKIVYRAKILPNQAFSAGPRLTPEEQAKIARALVAPEADKPTAKLRAAYKVGKSFALTGNDEYFGISEYLKNEWGYY
jgi:ABC-type phosphate/phosphonate transport system substrate-binding protein